jgi:uncharacterized protein
MYNKENERREMMKELANKLPRAAKTIWRIYEWIQIAVIVIVLAVFWILSIKFDWPIIMISIMTVIAVLYCIASYIFIPTIRWKVFSYEVREQEIEIQSGVFIVKRTIIPIIRVQHVEVAHGPIIKQKDLANIDITTAATTHTISLLSMEEADCLRHKIADLVKVAKEDV